MVIRKLTDREELFPLRIPTVEAIASTEPVFRLGRRGPPRASLRSKSGTIGQPKRCLFRSASGGGPGPQLGTMVDGWEPRAS